MSFKHQTYQRFLPLLVILALFATSCKSNKEIDDEAILKEVQSLVEIDDKREYLETILFEYQYLLDQESRFRKDNNTESKEYQQILLDKTYIEALNLKKISRYFEVHGYPNRAKVGHYAAITPLVCVYYSSSPEAYKKEEFKYFYGAYTFNDIPKDFFLPYLHSLYSSIKGERFKLDKNQKMEADKEIKLIMEELGFET